MKLLSSSPWTGAKRLRSGPPLSGGRRVTTVREFVMHIDQNLLATLYLLGFNFLGGDLFSGEIAEIKGDMTIKLVHPPGEELKFVVELPGEKQMIFSVDRHQIVSLAERSN
jgi:hypothetical protein